MVRKWKWSLLTKSCYCGLHSHIWEAPKIDPIMLEPLSSRTPKKGLLVFGPLGNDGLYSLHNIWP